MKFDQDMVKSLVKYQLNFTFTLCVVEISASSTPSQIQQLIMKNFNFLATCLIAMFVMGATNAKSLDVDSSDQSECLTPFASPDNPGKDYDFSYLKPGETADISGYDSNGRTFKYRVTRTSGGIDVAVYSASIKNADPNTVVTFKGPNGVISSTTLGQVASQRCGWLCVLVHVFCVKVHIGPPGNTWEWDCDTSTNEN